MSSSDKIIEWLKPMWNFCAGISDDPRIFGKLELVSSAAYIVHRKLGKNTKIFEIDDLNPYGMCGARSETVLKQIWILDDAYERKTVLKAPDKDSSEYNAGLCLRGFSEEEICLAALFLAYGAEKYKKSCQSLHGGDEKKEIGGRVLAEISRRITAALPKIIRR